MSYVPIWLLEVHPLYRLAHGSIINYTNNSIGSENKSSPAVICVSHRAHHRQFTVPRDVCFTGGRVQNPRLPKNLVNSHKHFSSPFSATDFSSPPGKCHEHVVGTHWSNLHVTPAVPAGFCALEKCAWKPRREKPHEPNHKSLCLALLRTGELPWEQNENGVENCKEILFPCLKYIPSNTGLLRCLSLRFCFAGCWGHCLSSFSTRLLWVRVSASTQHPSLPSLPEAPQ